MILGLMMGYPFRIPLVSGRDQLLSKVIDLADLG